jgi:hypothetical protein
MKTERFSLQYVQYMPKTLEPGVLYEATEFGTAAHLCACGCGSKIRTPLGPTEWQIVATPGGPTLRPSVGNWQKPCRSHYLITAGKVNWAPAWTEDRIAAGRRGEQRRREAYYDQLQRERSWIRRLIGWLKKLIRR